MKYRIAMWAGSGFLVAGFWALFAVATFPSTNERMREVWALVWSLQLADRRESRSEHYQVV